MDNDPRTTDAIKILRRRVQLAKPSMLERSNGKKSYTGLIGLGLTCILQGLGFMGDLQAVVTAVGLTDVDLFVVLVSFFGSLVGIGFTHKLTKATDAAGGHNGGAQ